LAGQLLVIFLVASDINGGMLWLTTSCHDDDDDDDQTSMNPEILFWFSLAFDIHEINNLY